MLSELLLVACTLAAVILLVVALVSLARGRPKAAAAQGAGLLALVVAYTAVLLGVSLASAPRTLAIGQWKCFGDWCVTVRTSRDGPVDGTRLVELDIRNRGHRAERPSTPRTFVILNGRRSPVAVPALGQRIDGGATGTLLVTLRLPPMYGRARLLVTEGAFPSQLCLGDENSPLHAQDTWQV